MAPSRRSAPPRRSGPRQISRRRFLTSGPAIDTFTIQVVSDEPTLVASLQTGEIDICSVSFLHTSTLERDPDLNVHIYDTTGFNMFNVIQDPEGSPLFLDRRVRQALMYGLDRDLIAETVYRGYAVRADGTQPILSIAYRPEDIETIYAFDPDRARELLDDADWRASGGDVREKDGVALRFECLFTDTAANYQQQLPYMKQAWQAIGVDMIPQALPFATMLNRLDAGDYEMALLGFSWSMDGA